MMDPFQESKAKLKEMINLLSCTKCEKLPISDVWMLTSCQHKYCKTCFDNLTVQASHAKKCERCHRLSRFDPKSSLPDLFSTDLLQNLRHFQCQEYPELLICSTVSTKVATPPRSSLRSLSRQKDVNCRPLSTRKRNASVMSEGQSSSSKNSTSMASPSVGSVTKRNAKGETALHIAARTGNIDKVEQLLDIGADIGAKDFAGWTPLHEAINGKTPNVLKVMELLLTKGCEVNVVGGFGHTPLHEAALLGNTDIINLLMSYGASNDILNENGLFPGDLAKTDKVSEVISKYKGPYKRKVAASDILSLSRQLQSSKALLFFAYPAESNFLQNLTDSFNLKFTTTFTREVTHVVFDVKAHARVPVSLNYLYGILTGAWLLSSEWLTKSLSGKTLLEPDPFDIGGPSRNSFGGSNAVSNGSAGAQKRARLNRQLKNPGLFQGIQFYIYKNSSYSSGQFKMDKNELGFCIRLGDGEVLNREPIPKMVNPLDSLVRFHAKDQSHPLILTSHIILFGDDKNEPKEKHNLEHVKSLRVNWLIESALQFTLCDPTPFLV